MKSRSIWMLGATAIVVLGAASSPRWLPLLHKPAATADAKADGKADAKDVAGKDGGKDAGKDGKDGKGKNGQRGPGGPLKVFTVAIKTQPLTETLAATGSLLADEGVELQAETNGKIVAIGFREGARVSRGQLLVKLNDSDLKAQRSLAMHNLELAQIREKRIQQLVQEGVVTQSDYDTAVHDVAVQQDQIAVIDAQIAKTEVRAPFDGIVGLRYVSEGSYVNATTRVATLQRIDRLKINFTVPEKYAGRIRVGAPVSFTVVGGSRHYSGEIYAYDPRIDATTRTVVIRATCPNPDGKLLPGAYANVEMKLDEIHDAILVPAEAVIPGLVEKNVFVLIDGKAQRQAVEIGTRTETQVQILSGLKPGDKLIVSALQQMRAGLAVADGGEPSPIGGDSGAGKSRRASAEDGSAPAGDGAGKPKRAASDEPGAPSPDAPAKPLQGARS